MSAIKDAIAERITARSIQVEDNIIGGLILENAKIPQVDLRPSDFVSGRHREYYAAIQSLYADRMPVDVLTVIERVERDTQRAPDLRTLAELVRDTVSGANVTTYAEALRGISMARKVRELGGRLLEHNGTDTQELIDDTIRELMDFGASKSDWSVHQYEAMQTAIDYIEQVASGNIGVSYGLRDLTNQIGGMHPGDFVVVAGRPAMGKTAFMLNMLGGCNVPAGCTSGEQNRSQIGMRLLSIHGHLSLHKMRKGFLDDAEWARANAVFTRLKNQPLWINDKPGPTIDDVKRQARAWRFEKAIKLLVVDYLQKISAGGRGRTRDEEVGYVASELKNLARELDIPVVALAQVNRKVEELPLGPSNLGRMPQMSDIRESGTVEAEADTVLTLYRPEVYVPDDPLLKGAAYVNVCKSRHGPVGKIPIAWRGEYLQFGDLAHTERE